MTSLIDFLSEEFGKKTVDAAVEKLVALEVEVPSLGFGRGDELRVDFMP